MFKKIFFKIAFMKPRRTLGSAYKYLFQNFNDDQ